MRVDVWSDVICPWCWLGNARLDKALASFPHAAEVEVVPRSFELDPTTPKDLDVPTDTMLAKKLNVGPAQIQAMHARLRGLGEAEGIEYRFERARTSNTFDAHQLIHLGRARGKAAAVATRLFRANFNQGVRVADRKELVRLAADVGLDGAEAEEALADQRFALDVRADEEQARGLGISGVPFFLVDGRLAVSGAQPVEVMLRMLDAGWEKRQARPEAY